MGLVTVAATDVRAYEVGRLYFLPILALFETVAAFYVVFLRRVSGGPALEAMCLAVKVRFVQFEAALALVKDDFFLPGLGSALNTEEGEDVSEDVSHDFAVGVFD